MLRRTPLILILFFSLLASKAYSQNECFPFQIGNGFSLSKDSKTVFLSKPTGANDSIGKPIYGIYKSMKEPDGSWSEPEPVSFGMSAYTEYHPVLNQENDRLFFISRRPEPGAENGVSYGNLWYVEKIQDQWSEPKFLAEINQKGHDTYPTLTKDGTLYFNSDRPGGKGSMDIYMSKFVDGKYQPAQPIDALNTSESENDLVIHPDGNWIIFNRYFFDSGELDMFICFHENGHWTKPIALDIINQKGVFELTPSLSPDLLTFFYEVNGRIKCIPLVDILDSVKN